MKNDVASSNGKGVKTLLRRYIGENFLPQSGFETFKDSDSFLEKGIIDSTGILELLEFIEEEFKISVDDDEVVPDNLDSLDSLTRFIQEKLSHAAP